jgi:hypothetical protein
MLIFAFKISLAAADLTASDEGNFCPDPICWRSYFETL